MKSYLNWLDEQGFWINEYWDADASIMREGGAFLVLQPHQRALAGHALTPLPNGRFRYNRVLWSEVKKSGKTKMGASFAAWYADEGPAGTEIYLIANDSDQSKDRMFKDVLYHVRERVPEAWSTAEKITYPNGTTIQLVAQHYKSAAGGRHALTIWDELHGFTSEGSRRLWAEMTPIPTIPLSLQIVVTYAGYEGESDLLWEMYLRGVGVDEHEKGEGQPIEDAPELEGLPCWSNGRLFCYWSHDPRMPWQTEEYYEDERQNSRPADYLRLHENRWVTSHEAFIDPSWYDVAAKHFTASALIKDHPYQGWPLYVAVDVGPRHDNSTVVGVAYDRPLGKVAQVFHKIWKPVEGEDFDLEATVEKFLLYVSKRFKVRMIGYDPYQFHRSMVTLKGKGLPLEPIDQNAGNMVAASQGLFDLLRQKNFWTYPDDTAREHIKNAVAKDTGRGFRIIKDPTQAKARKGATRKPVDYAVALAMACHLAIESGGVDVSKGVKIESPFGDVSAWVPVDKDQLALPYPLRS